MNNPDVEEWVERLAPVLQSREDLFEEGQDQTFTARWLMKQWPQDVRQTGLSAQHLAMIGFIKGITARHFFRHTDDGIRTFTRKAFEHAQCKRDSKAIRTLTEQKGIRVAAASAILAWVLPHRYAVLDERVARALRFFGISVPNVPTAERFYAKEYLPLTRKLSEQFEGRTPQQVDVWLYNHNGRGLPLS